jgi:hypothetical protein
MATRLSSTNTIIAVLSGWHLQQQGNHSALGICANRLETMGLVIVLFPYFRLGTYSSKAITVTLVFVQTNGNIGVVIFLLACSRLGTHIQQQG